MDLDSLPADLRRTVEFHGHLCPGLLIGYRAALAAAAALEVEPAADEELVAVVENDSCAVDAFQALLSTTFGKGNLIWRDHGKQAFTLLDRRGQRAVRVAFKGDDLKEKLPDGSIDREAFMSALLSGDNDRLFKVTPVAYQPPAAARIEPSLICSRCGEAVQASRSIDSPQGPLCRPCAAELGL